MLRLGEDSGGVRRIVPEYRADDRWQRTEDGRQMSEVWNPHDRLFKEIWSDREAAADFLSRYFPEGVRRLVVFDTLEIWGAI